MTQAISAVLFDLDGTLFDHDGSARQGVQGLVASLGRELTPELADAWFAAEDRHVATWLAGDCSWTEQRRRRLVEFLPRIDPGMATLGPEQLDQLFATYLVAYEQAWHAFDDAAPALDAVRDAGYTVGMLTNGQRDQQLAKLARIGLLDLVGPVWATRDLGVAKPDPSAFWQACQGLNHPVATTVRGGQLPPGCRGRP